MYRVILVDDERLIIQGLTKVLPWEKLGCQVIDVAYDGASGLEKIREQKPDIVMTDIRMPNMDGLTMLAAIHSEFPEIQMAVLTAYRDFDYAQRAMHIGVCRFLLKPSKMDELEEAFRFMVGQLQKREAEKKLEDLEEEPTVQAAGNHLVTAALDYMRAHCTEPHLSLTEVASHVYVSQWHLSKLLNRETNQSFFELLGNMRIERAKQLLKDPSLRIHQVAEATGYADVAHFSKSFKKYTGQTPGDYRNHPDL
ncbi:MAG: response regulator [Clostridia bacterium]|nr:response regulator [Clostridia bacterium]